MAVKNVVSFKTVEDMAKFDFNRIIVEDIEERESMVKDDFKGKDKRSKPKSGIKYYRMNITYKYSEDIRAPLLIRFPEMETSGITEGKNRYISEDGKPKLQIRTPILSNEYIKFFDRLQDTILSQMKEIINDPKNEKLKKKFKFEDADFTRGSRLFRTFYRDSEAKPGVYRMYFPVREYSAFFVPERKRDGGYITKGIPQKSILEGSKRRYNLKIIPIWQPSNIYIGINHSIVNYLKQAVVKSINIFNQTSVVDDELEDILGEDFNEGDVREALSLADNASDDSDDDNDDSDEEEEETRRPAKGSSSKTSFRKAMDSSDDEEDDGFKKVSYKKKGKSKALSSDEEDE